MEITLGRRLVSTLSAIEKMRIGEHLEWVAESLESYEELKESLTFSKLSTLCPHPPYYVYTNLSW